MTKLLLFKSLILILFSFCILSSKINKVSKEAKKQSKHLSKEAKESKKKGENSRKIKSDPIKVESSCNNAIHSKSFKKDAKKGEIFMILSKKEINHVVSWMIDSNPDLNLTSFDSATLNDNYVHKVTLAEPDKTEALAYIENDNDSKKPIRSARVVC